MREGGRPTLFWRIHPFPVYFVSLWLISENTEQFPNVKNNRDEIGLPAPTELCLLASTAQMSPSASLAHP